MIMIMIMMIMIMMIMIMIMIMVMIMIMMIMIMIVIIITLIIDNHDDDVPAEYHHYCRILTIQRCELKKSCFHMGTMFGLSRQRSSLAC